MASWRQEKDEYLDLIESHTPYDEIIGMNTITITAACSHEPVIVHNKSNNTWYWTLELWEPGAKNPLQWKVLFSSGLFDKELSAMNEGSWVIITGYVRGWYDKEYLASNGEHKQKLVLVVNGTDIHLLRKRAKKVET